MDDCMCYPGNPYTVFEKVVDRLKLVMNEYDYKIPDAAAASERRRDCIRRIKNLLFAVYEVVFARKGIPNDCYNSDKKVTYIMFRYQYEQLFERLLNLRYITDVFDFGVGYDRITPIRPEKPLIFSDKEGEFLKHVVQQQD